MLVSPESSFEISMNSMPQMAAINRRRAKREPANDLSEIISEKGNPVCGCVVHNISKLGAMLEVSSNQIPSRFLLINHQRKTKVACNVVWHCGCLMGVEFLTTPRPV